jgi:hypothetical protein
MREGVAQEGYQLGGFPAGEDEAGLRVYRGHAHLACLVLLEVEEGETFCESWGYVVGGFLVVEWATQKWNACGSMIWGREVRSARVIGCRGNDGEVSRSKYV